MTSLDEVKEYLDTCIRHWRQRKEEKVIDGNGHFYFMCECYIDAYQSMRQNIFGEVLPENENS